MEDKKKIFLYLKLSESTQNFKYSLKRVKDYYYSCFTKQKIMFLN